MAALVRHLSSSKRLPTVTATFVRFATYKTPQRDIDFVLQEVLDTPKHYEKLGFSECNADLIKSVVDECARFSEGSLLPLDSVGDKQGCKLVNGSVVTPKGFKEAYSEYCSGGWQAMTVPSEYGGQGERRIKRRKVIGMRFVAVEIYQGIYCSMYLVDSVYLPFMP